MADETATLILKPSWLTIGGAVVGVVMFIFIGRMWLAQTAGRSGQGFWGLAFPLGIVGLAIIQGYRSLRQRTLVLTPASLSVVTGESAQTVPWSDIEAIRPKRLWQGRSSSLGIAIVRKTRGDIRLRDVYETPREEVYGFLTGYAVVHAPHVKTGEPEGMFG